MSLQPSPLLWIIWYIYTQEYIGSLLIDNKIGLVIETAQLEDIPVVMKI